MRYFILFFSLFFLTSCGPGESDKLGTEDSVQAETENDKLTEAERARRAWRNGPPKDEEAERVRKAWRNGPPKTKVEDDKLL